MIGVISHQQPLNSDRVWSILLSL